MRRTCGKTPLKYVETMRHTLHLLPVLDSLDQVESILFKHPSGCAVACESVDPKDVGIQSWNGPIVQECRENCTHDALALMTGCQVICECSY